jgi:hypothetical protein
MPGETAMSAPDFLDLRMGEDGRQRLLSERRQFRGGGRLCGLRRVRLRPEHRRRTAQLGRTNPAGERRSALRPLPGRLVRQQPGDATLGGFAHLRQCRGGDGPGDLHVRK